MNIHHSKETLQTNIYNLKIFKISLDSKIVFFYLFHSLIKNKNIFFLFIWFQFFHSYLKWIINNYNPIDIINDLYIKSHDNISTIMNNEKKFIKIQKNSMISEEKSSHFKTLKITLRFRAQFSKIRGILDWKKRKLFLAAKIVVFRTFSYKKSWKITLFLYFWS